VPNGTIADVIAPNVGFVVAADADPNPNPNADDEEEDEDDSWPNVVDADGGAGAGGENGKPNNGDVPDGGDPNENDKGWLAPGAAVAKLKEF
jgi:hypothetical protein